MTAMAVAGRAYQGPYSMDEFGRDVLSVLDALKIKKINWCGLSMGGMVGQWLGANAPDRIDKLILQHELSLCGQDALE
jgi:3-oxoadipate enol-lactonase